MKSKWLSELKRLVFAAWSLAVAAIILIICSFHKINYQT